MLLPQIQETQERAYADRTYRLDRENGRIQGKLDGMAALSQAVRKLLTTEKGAYPIYPNYGVELEGLIGKDFLFASSMAKRSITDALLSDDRILSVDDFTFDREGDAVAIEFSVNTIYGILREEVSL